MNPPAKRAWRTPSSSYNADLANAKVCLFFCSHYLAIAKIESLKETNMLKKFVLGSLVIAFFGSFITGCVTTLGHQIDQSSYSQIQKGCEH